jgi:HlyD family secretion protein
MRFAVSLFLLAIAAPAFAQDASAPALTLPAITVSTVETRILRDVVIASGLVAPVETVQVAPLIEGQPIEALLADVGDTVQAGQVLARLSSSTLELQKAQLNASYAAANALIAQAEAQQLEAISSAAEAQRVADRTAALRKQGSASQAAAEQSAAAATSANARAAVAAQSLESARAQQTLVQAQLDNLALQLSRTEVKAPFAGEITARNAQLGAIASAQGQPMFTLIRDGALELRADLSEVDLVRVAPGQTAVLTQVGGTAPLMGTVRLVEPTIDAATRLGRARITIADTTTIRAGMFVEASILVVERETIAIPVTAVGSFEGAATVMKVSGASVARVPVTTGIRDGGWVEIIKGIAPGDLLVKKAGSFVRDGDQINPIPAATN